MKNKKYKVKIIIIGAGLTGLSAARSARVRDTINSVPSSVPSDVVIFEKNKTAGGLCRTEESDGFLFDYTGHFLHFNNKEIKDEILEFFKGNTLLKIKRSSFIYFKEKFIPYPFQSNVYHLPEKVRSDCLRGFLNSLKYPMVANNNFYDWMRGQFGDGIVKHFMLPYNSKMWRIHPRELTTEWMSRFVPRPQAEEIIAGAVGPQKEVKGYNATFYYPAGGIKELVKKVSGNKIKILYNNKVKKVNSLKKTIYADGKKYHYDFLIVTTPLKEFALKMLEHANDKFLGHAGRLKYTSVLNINIGWRGAPAKKVPPGTHWIYFPESKFSFYRIGFLPAVSCKMVPKDSWSCYIEVSYPGGKLPPKEKYGEIEIKVIKQLKGAGIIPNSTKIVKILTLPIEVAYVVYDKNWKTSRNFILNYLKEKNIFCGGRYGGWEYSTMEDALTEGRRLMKLCLRQPLR